MLVRATFPSLDRMDIASMIMGGAIVSIVWIVVWPWSQLKRLRALEATAGEDPDQAS